MNPVQKALWYIESHFVQDISLDEIASVAGVSRFHVSRAFGLAVGCPVVRYLRGRRLTEAARALASGAPDILEVALEAGYGSHEAFTRAFRDHFGLTPEAVRAQRHLENIQLVEAIRMESNSSIEHQTPHIENGKPLLLAGLREHFDCETGAEIPMLWQRFGPYIGAVPGQVGAAAYGVCIGDDAANMDYMTGVEVASFAATPPELSQLRLPEQRYAVFLHREHVAAIRDTWRAVWSEWLPKSGHEVAAAPVLERYGESFDRRTGMGGVELWIPIRS